MERAPKKVCFDLKATVKYDDALSIEDYKAAAKEARREATMKAATRCRPPRVFVFEEETEVEKVTAANTKKNAEKCAVSASA